MDLRHLHDHQRFRPTPDASFLIGPTPAVPLLFCPTPAKLFGLYLTVELDLSLLLASFSSFGSLLFFWLIYRPEQRIYVPAVFLLACHHFLSLFISCIPSFVTTHALSRHMRALFLQGINALLSTVTCSEHNVHSLLFSTHVAVLASNTT
jgi:hypothetical protein